MRGLEDRTPHAEQHAQLLAPHRGLHRADFRVERRAVGSEGLAPCARLGLALGERLKSRHALVLHRPKHCQLALGE